MNRPTIAEQQDLVKESLFQFVRKHIPSAQLSSIDEIVLDYVVSILEDLGTETSVEEAFDVEAFCEMMEAFFPQFSAIHPAAVCQWMFQLEDTLSHSKQAKDENDFYNRFHNSLMLAPLSAHPLDCDASKSPHTNSEAGDNPKGLLGGVAGELPKRVHQLSETSDVSSDSSGEYSGHEDTPYFSAQLQLLQEMFPGSSSLEVRHCLAIAEGDVGRAVQIVLHRQEAGQSLAGSSPLAQPLAQRNKPVVDDNELKSRIIARYSYVDKDDDVREHRPVGPKVEPKKLVRYRDNKIVSLKGERFTEMKKEEDDDMKKTYVSIKPAKQYRFH